MKKHPFTSWMGWGSEYSQQFFIFRWTTSLNVTLQHWANPNNWHGRNEGRITIEDNSILLQCNSINVWEDISLARKIFFSSRVNLWLRAEICRNQNKSWPVTQCYRKPMNTQWNPLTAHIIPTSVKRSQACLNTSLRNTHALLFRSLHYSHI